MTHELCQLRQALAATAWPNLAELGAEPGWSCMTLLDVPCFKTFCVLLFGLSV